MKHKTWFRLMLKVLGVWFMASAVASIATALAQLGIAAAGMGRTSFPWFIAIAPLIQLVVGLYLFFGGKWIADNAIPSNRPYCHECGYNLTGAVGNICNECGTAFRSEVAGDNE